jgi:hypothetical protein
MRNGRFTAMRNKEGGRICILAFPSGNARMQIHPQISDDSVHQPCGPVSSKEWIEPVIFHSKKEANGSHFVDFQRACVSFHMFVDTFWAVC